MSHLKQEDATFLSRPGGRDMDAVVGSLRMTWPNEPDIDGRTQGQVVAHQVRRPVTRHREDGVAQSAGPRVRRLGARAFVSSAGGRVPASCRARRRALRARVASSCCVALSCGGPRRRWCRCGSDRGRSRQPGPARPKWLEASPAHTADVRRTRSELRKRRPASAHRLSASRAFYR